MEITESWLAQIGGWQAIKAARSLVAGGHVAVSQNEGGLIRGTAGAGKMKFASGLRIRSRSDVDNLCTCPMARRSGMICEHSLAVALATLQKATPAPRPSGQSSQSGPPTPLVEAPKIATIAGQYTLFLPETLREPLGVLVKHDPAGSETSRLAAWLAGQGITKPQTVPLSLRGPQAEAFLEVLGGHPRVLWGKPGPTAKPLQIAADPVRMPLVIESAAGGQIHPRLANPSFRQVFGPWWLCGETMVLFRVKAPAGIWTAFGQPQPLRWLVEHREALDDAFQVDLRGELLSGFHVLPVPLTFEITLEGSLQAVEARLAARFGETTWPILPQGVTSTAKPPSFPLVDPQNAACFYLRDESAERRMVGRLKSLGFRASDRGHWLMQGGDAVLKFYASDLPRLRDLATIIEGDRWRTVTRGVQRIQPKTVVHEGGGGSGQDWLSMEFAYQAADGFRLPRNDVLRMIRSGQKSVQGRDGKRYILDAEAVEELEETLRDVPLQLTPEGARIHSAHAAYFQGENVTPIKLPDATLVQSVLAGLNVTLRSYQAEGFEWLLARAQAGRGGILADDMGLGKTLQAIALVSACRNGPSMVVCPKSLLGNWRSEFERFAPSIKVTVVSGSGREKALETMDANSVIITSYPLISRDLTHYQKQDFELVLLDEASAIKNPDTEAAKALRSLKAKARFAITGTPLENGVRDLWSVMTFALPGYLGSRDNFKERFEQPIASSLASPAGQQAVARLRKLIRPWFLRRTKKQVLRDLPEKIEQVLWCDPSPAQAEVYRRVLEEGRDEIKAARRSGGQGGARMTMFTVLLRLRQVCCDLRLTGLPPEMLKGLDADDLSGKWPALQERLDAILETGGKVLIFSQFVQFLKLLRHHLDVTDVPYCYLDGQTQDREGQVKAFQTQPDKRVFLISLKAGGYGLNLTAADHVILADPWWNPAVEAQAIDRAHRLGQQRVVHAFRLATRGTVEERILALQAKKRGLIEATVEDDATVMTGLTETDLEELLA
ncbi:MAG: SNF2 helicase associated domain-containing protein [Verrucomicrobiaceae bacterium]|nr:SNF2 helicase associated domain-containing protein [Verrucomicrobiaceae bacterium]